MLAKDPRYNEARKEYEIRLKSGRVICRGTKEECDALLEEYSKLCVGGVCDSDSKHSSRAKGAWKTIVLVEDK